MNKCSIKTKAVAVVLALTSILSASSIISVSAVEKNSNNLISKQGTFYYPSDTREGQDATGTYYYSDNYFYDTSYKYNKSLSTMSLCLELSAWPSNREPLTTSGYEKKSRNYSEICSQLSFENVEVNADYKKKPTTDSIGVAAASKKINNNGNEYTLVAVALRGGFYESEWASNLTLGKSGEHEGFKKLADKVIEFTKNYIDKYAQGKTKLWLVGYSRGGAVAGLTGKWFDDNAVDTQKYNISKNDIYTDTFESPQGAEKSDEKIAMEHQKSSTKTFTML